MALFPSYDDFTTILAVAAVQNRDNNNFPIACNFCALDKAGEH
jgi:hypothetical protein